MLSAGLSSPLRLAISGKHVANLSSPVAVSPGRCSVHACSSPSARAAGQASPTSTQRSGQGAHAHSLLGQHGGGGTPTASPSGRTSVRARALFGSSSDNSPPSPPSPNASREGPQAREAERSAMVNEEIVYFIFQLDLDTQLQRALNYEAYEQAKEIRAKRERVDGAMSMMKERKASNLKGGDAGEAEAGPSLNATDYAAQGLTLRGAMQAAVAREDYKEAARLKGELAVLEAAAKRSEAAAAEITGGVAFVARLRLGQRVVHAVHGYRGVVAGWDAQCCESEEWVEASGAGSLKNGTKQPFYHVLVDQRDWEYDAFTPPVAYLADELLWVPESGTPPPANSQAMPLGTPATGDEPLSWSEAFGSEALKHPYMYILFLGQDARGDYLPCRQLRDKYAIKRRDVYRPGEDGSE